MSADLFAAFGDSQPQSQPRSSAQVASSSSDPFAFPAVSPANTNFPLKSQDQPWPSLRPLNETLPRPSGLGAQKKSNSDIDDDWGDFEVPQPPPNPAQQPVSSAAVGMTALPGLSQISKEAPNPQRTRIVRAPTIELMTNSLIDLPGANALPDDVRSPPRTRKSFEPFQQTAPKAPPPKSRPKDIKVDSSVLFDADDFAGEDGGEDEDFGEFIASPGQPPPDLVSGDLFGPPTTAQGTSSPMFSVLSPGEPTSPYPQAPKSPGFQQRNPFPGLAVKTPTEPKPSQDLESKASPTTAWPSIDQGSTRSHRGPSDDDWGAFGDPPKDTEPRKITVPTVDDDWNWDNEPAAKPKAREDAGASWNWESVITQNEESSRSNEGTGPPINIPPPAILLSVFPHLLGQANSSLFKPIGGHPFGVKNRILSDPKTVDFLRGYLLLATVGARVMAGRKLRWHRDKFLAKGMSISAAGSKGMKLAGVDKTQSTREDREASDVLDVWKENLGRLRSAVGAANSTIRDSKRQLTIPELRESMPVQTAKMVPTAPKACVICGMKRDERIPRVDFDVEDIFDEWWVEHWGHTTCKRFWLQHENALRQR